MSMRTKQETVSMFRYKTPTEETMPKHKKVTESFITLVEGLYDEIPDGPGKTFALRELQIARMAFNSAIANNGQ